MEEDAIYRTSNRSIKARTRSCAQFCFKGFMVDHGAGDQTNTTFLWHSVKNASILHVLDDTRRLHNIS